MLEPVEVGEGVGAHRAQTVVAPPQVLGVVGKDGGKLVQAAVGAVHEAVLLAAALPRTRVHLAPSSIRLHVCPRPEKSLVMLFPFVFFLVSYFVMFKLFLLE